MLKSNDNIYLKKGTPQGTQRRNPYHLCKSQQNAQKAMTTFILKREHPKAHREGTHITFVSPNKTAKKQQQHLFKNGNTPKHTEKEPISPL